MASAELQIPEHIQETQNITREELEMILHTQNPLVTEELRRRAQQTAKAIYENKIYVRGLIEFTNYCKNNCYYCGIRCSNRMQTDTGFLWNRFCPAVKQDGILVFGLLFCRAEKIRISQMNIFVRLSARLKKYTLTVQ